MTSHKQHVEKLNLLEIELVRLISNQDNDELTEAFIEWQKQRIVCNESFNQHINEILKS